MVETSETDQQSSSTHTGRGVELAWLGATAAVTALLSAIPLVFWHRFYFADDTQAGAWPIWVTIGESLRSGALPFFEPGRWMAGNLVAEGQWGLFNPVIWAVGLGATVVTNGVIFSTLVKVAALMVAATGVYALARTFGASRVWSMIGGVAAAATGFTVYVDAASWVTALFVWALLPWAWAGLRLCAMRGWSVLWAFLPGYVLVTVGYVHGTLMLVGVVAAVLVEAALARRWPGFWRGFIASSLLGLVAIAVYLPGVLTAPVTARDSDGITNSNFMSPDLSGLLSSAVPTGTPWLTGFWATPTPAPLMYISWLLPLFLLVRWDLLRRHAVELSSLVVVGVIAAMLAFGPSEIGPLRFPARLLPYVSLVLVVLLVVAISRWPARVTRGRAIGIAVWLLAATYAAYAEHPAAWERLALTFVAVAVALVVTLRALSRGGSALRLAATVMIATTVLVALQHFFYPRSPLPEFRMPASVEDYADMLADGPGDTLVIGAPLRADVPTEQITYANGWLLADSSVINVYSPVMHKAFAEEMCMDAHGVACWELADRLWETDEATGLPLADLLAISSVQIVPRAADEDDAYDPLTEAAVPAGWHEAARDETGALWVRDQPLDGAGGVVWASDGLELGSITVTSTRVEIPVDSVPAEGGTVVLSRLDWPGYTVTGASLGESTRNYLVTLDVPGDAAGSTVVLEFTPPAWMACLGALGLALFGAFGWAIVEAVRRRQRR